MGLEWLKENLSSRDARDLRKLLDSNHPELSVGRQCELLGRPRATHYYQPTPVRESTRGVMASIDALYLVASYGGSRRMVDYLAREGIPISRDLVGNLLPRNGLRAIYQKPRTTVSGHPSERFPCLVGLNQVRAIDQVWATYRIYIPLRKGFLCLVAIVDLFSSHILSGKLSNSFDTEFCLETLDMALAGGHKPETFHLDQGCQFISTAFVGHFKAEAIKLSWSGRWRCYDNNLVERLGRTLHSVAAGFSAKPSRGLPACL